MTQKKQVVCDYCGCSFFRDMSHLKGKKHHFCSRECLANFSNKEKNPDGYRDLKDFTNISANMSRVNKKLNPTRMTLETREKIRISKMSAGNGRTYEKTYGVHTHRIVAEQMLGRPLHEGEVVHHIDGNKRNNDPSNLRVFSSQSEHAKFHKDLDEVLKMINS